MKSPFKKTLIYVGIVEFCDLLVLNLMCCLYYWLDVHFKFSQSVLIHSHSYWLICNITYFISINCVYIVLHNRMIRPETIISKAGRTIILQILLFLAALSFYWISAPSIYTIAAFSFPLFIAITLERLILHKCIGYIRFTGHDNLNIVLVGEGKNIQDLAIIMNDKWNGYKLRKTFAKKDIDAVVPYITSHHVDEVYCGIPSEYKDKILPIISYCENNLIRFFSVPNLQNYLSRKVSMRRVGNVTVLAIRKEPLSHFSNRLLKRSFDLIVSSLFLCTLYPIIYIIIGSIIKLTSPGPVYFKQQRTGLDGKIFTCIKFRSMRVNDDSDKVQATKDDPRKTTFGKFLRHYNVDELPQFINVWKGEMSLVGPRPHMLEHTEYYSQLINQYMVRHLVKPGITGWAQITGYRGETKKLSDMEGRVKQDIWYIENWTFWWDIHIIIKTLLNMTQGEPEAY